MDELQILPPDMEEVREQLEQQRVLAAQLREKLHQDEQQLVSKELQNERLKSKLSLIKSRSRAKRESGLSEKGDRSLLSQESVGELTKRADSKLPSPSGLKRTPCSANKGKINILREQLEQNRLRFEKHDQELNEDARSMEAVVEQLRHELEERDVTIQHLQAGQPAETPVVDERVTEPMDLVAQLAQKDAYIGELLTRATDLQNSVLELQENLREKDCVIEARTQAITLLSEDMSKKWKANVDMLEETRQQMHIMQENFVGIEAGLNAEIEHQRQQLDRRSKKIAQLEQNLKQAEAARFDLASRNAELQEKLVNIQELSSGCGAKDAQAKVDELSKALSEANKMAIKLKAEHKSKVKMLSKQIDSLRKESGASEEVVRLQNHIAELEEEKGIQEAVISKLHGNIAELQEMKMAAEMRVVEVEEEFKTRNFELKMTLMQREEEVESLREKLSEMEEKEKGEEEASLSKARGDLTEWQNRCGRLESDLEKQREEMESLFQSCRCGGLSEKGIRSFFSEGDFEVGWSETELKKKDLELDEIKMKLSSYEKVIFPKIEFLESSLHEKRLQVQELESLLQINMNKIEILTLNLTGQNSASQITELQGSHAEQLDQQLGTNNMKVTLKEFEDLKVDLANVIQERDALKDQLRCVSGNFSKSQKESDGRKDPDSLERELIETFGELDLKREECARLETKLKAQVEKSKKIAVSLKAKSVANKDLEDKVAKFESEMELTKSQIDQLSKEKQDAVEKWGTEVLEKETVLIEMASKLTAKEVEIQGLKEDLCSKTSLICQLETTLANTKKQLDDLSLSLNEKSSIDKSETEAKLAELHSQLTSAIEEKCAAISRFETLTKSVKIKLAKEKKVRSDLEQKLRELEDSLKEKTNVVSKMCEQFGMERASLEAVIKEKNDCIESLRKELDEEMCRLHFASQSSICSEHRSEVAQELQFDVIRDVRTGLENPLASSTSNKCSSLQNISVEKAKCMDDLKYKLESLHKMIAMRMNSTPNLETEWRLLNQLEDSFTKIRYLTSALEAEVQRLVSEGVEAEAKLLRQNMETLEATLAETKQCLVSAESDKQTLEVKLNHVQNELSSVEQLLIEERQRAISLDQLSQQNELEIMELRKKVSSQEERDRDIRDAAEQLEEMRLYTSSLARELQLSQEKEGLMQINLDTMSKETANLKEQLSQAAEREDALHLKLDILLKEVNDLKIKLDESKNKECCLQDELNSSKQSVEYLEKQLDECQDQILSLRRCELDMKNKIATSEEELQKHAYQNNTLNCQLTDLKQNMRTLETELEKEKQMREEAVARLGAAEQSLAGATARLSGLEQQSTEITAQYDVLASQKQQAETYIAELTHKLLKMEQKTAKVDSASAERTRCDPHADNANEELLRQQLVEKTAEVESYQRRLLQLQMGGSASPASFFETVGGPRSNATNEIEELRKRVTELQHAIESHQCVSAPAHSLDEASHLQQQVTYLTEELQQLQTELVQSKREQETLSHLRADAENLTKQLEEAQAEVEKSRVDSNILTNLRDEVADLTQKLAEAQEKIDVAKELQNQIKELETKLERERLAEADRPSIPQSLDTHVSSLDTNDPHSNFYGQEESSTMDESLMERNMNQLESELSGMVTSQQERRVENATARDKPKPKTNEDDWNLEPQPGSEAEVWTWDTDTDADGEAPTGTPQDPIASLKLRLKEMESEKNEALREMKALQEEVGRLTSASVGPVGPVGTATDTDTTVSVGDDDGWGWNSDHPRNENHEQLCQVTPPICHEELHSKIAILEAENEVLQGNSLQLTEALKAAQLRGAKLVKKAKELKQKYDDLAERKPRSESQFDILDQAIEEERAKQMQNLEKELKEVRSEIQMVHSERDKLVKQVQVLTSANERLVEVKERQDVDLEMWQKRSKDLTNQVQVLEWRINELQEEKTTEVLNPIEVEQLLKENHTWNANYETLMQEYQKLRGQCLSDSEQRAHVDNQLIQQKGIIERLEHEKKYLQDVYDALKMDEEAANAQLASKAELDVKLAQALAENVQLECVRKDLMQQVDEAEKKIQDLLLRNAELTNMNRLLAEEQNMKQNSSLQRVQDASSDLTASASLDWNSLVNDKRPADSDVFDSIVSNPTRHLEEQLNAKDVQLQRDRRMIETLKRTHEEAEREWSHIIDHHKYQLESSQALVEELKRAGEDEKDQVARLQHNLAMSQAATLQLKLELESKDNEIQKLQERVEVLEMEASLRLEAASPAAQSAPSTPSTELDLALYRLHQRDVRCDELTLELMRLLEERDTLQLRLSNAIRMNEDLREKMRQLRHLDVSSPPDGDSSSRRSPDVSHAADGCDDRTRSGHSQHGLEDKLAELHSVGYGKDKWLRDESELRHEQQMRLLATPPPPTVVDSPPVLPTSDSAVEDPDAHDANQSSSESQSLLDWLWGRR